uniref:DUF8039 domain-containing protein n=1 Tax=Setaria viridis TaxID=4556 RepID=A0A4U6W9U2_SETVI|nr:hypothetical protein SEVIR_1G120900v2 [Setaria viridis]
MRLVELIKATTEGSFIPDREKDELTMALELQEHVALREARMEEAIDRCVALALSKRATEQATASLGANVNDNQRHPVDDITGRAPCELVTPMKNKLIVVAYGVAKQPTQGQTIHGVEIPAGGYTKVGVDRVADGWEDLELEILGGDGEKNLGEAIHGWILWPKRYIRITQPNLSILGSSPQGSRVRSSTPSARVPSPLPDKDPSMSLPADRDPSMTPHSPPADRDPSMSPPPPVMSKTTRRKTRLVPPTTATKKKQKKPKEKQPKPKKAYEMTDTEINAVVDAKVKAHFAPKPVVKKDPPLDKVKLQAFIRIMEKKAEKPPLSDYERSITKVFQKNKKNNQHYKKYILLPYNFK